MAVTSRRALWLVSSTGSDEVLPAVDEPVDPTFSADHHWLSVTTRGHSARTWVLRADGSGLRQLAASTSPLGWSPSGHLLATGQLSSQPTSAAPAYRPTTVSVVDPVDMTRRTVAVVKGFVGAVWSPDGRDLAVSASDSPMGVTGITAYPVSGGPATPWFATDASSGRLAGMSELLLTPAGWWPDRGIAFWVVGDGATDDVNRSPLDVVTAPTRTPQSLGSTAVNLMTTVAAVSATGKLALVRQVGEGNDRSVWQDKHVAVCPPDAGRCPLAPEPTATVTLDPAWSPDGHTLAYVQAPALADVGFPRARTKRWYAGHRLVLEDTRSGHVQVLAGTVGASAPMWSDNGRELLYAAGNALWLLRSGHSRAVRVVSPLFGHRWDSPVGRGPWSSYYGQIHWSGQFAWSNAGS